MSLRLESVNENSYLLPWQITTIVVLVLLFLAMWSIAMRPKSTYHWGVAAIVAGLLAPALAVYWLRTNPPRKPDILAAAKAVVHAQTAYHLANTISKMRSTERLQRANALAHGTMMRLSEEERNQALYMSTIVVKIGNQNWLKSEEALMRRVHAVVAGHDTDFLPRRIEEKTLNGGFRWDIFNGNWFGEVVNGELILGYRYANSSFGEEHLSRAAAWLETVFEL